MARLAREAHDFPVIKVKLGGTEDEECLAAIREARPDTHLRVDCNAGWTLDEAQRRIPRLEQYGLEMIEQPCRARKIGRVGRAAKADQHADRSGWNLCRVLRIWSRLPRLCAGN